MAYPAMVSLQTTIRGLLYSCRISLVSPSEEILKSAYEETRSLKHVLEKSDEEGREMCESERERTLEGEMREEVWKFEDVLESHFLSQILPQSESDPLLFSVDLLDLGQTVDSFSARMKKMVEEYNEELDHPLVEEDDDDVLLSTTPYFGGDSPIEMVGFTDMFAHIRDALLRECTDHPVTLIFGMAGIGKTTIAKKILEDPSIRREFDCRVFVPVGQKSSYKKLCQALLAQLDPNCDKTVMEEHDLSGYFRKSGDRRKFLIVFDDVWDGQRFLLDVLDILRRSSSSMILLTTRQEKIYKLVFSEYLDLRFMNKEESWELLCGKVFADKVCPPQLEKAGKKIAENCEGLPLLIVTVASLLSEADKTLQLWEEVAADKQNSIFEKAYDQISEVLYPSYNFLDKFSRACFLYLAAFPQNYQVVRSRLMNMWTAERLIKEKKSAANYLKRCLRHLLSNNVVLVIPDKGSGNTNEEVLTLHSVFWYFCKKEARKTMFLHVLNRYDDGFIENIESQRRLSIYKNVLFAIKDVYKSVESVLNARSLLCTGGYHQYQVPVCFGLRLLRVLDALTIRFYEFPIEELLRLVQLRYLSLTTNLNLCPSISKLWNLQYLIVHQHMSIKFTLTESYLPIEIWYLQELKYLEIMGRNLPDPPQGIVLENLLELLDVGPCTCTEHVAKSIPNLKKLRVQIELTPDATEPLICFDHISHHGELKSLECVVVNPEIVAQPLPPPLSFMTSHIKKLTLSGFGYPWKDMKSIAELQALQVLKLQCYAFRGEKWEAKEECFNRLHYLSIEDTDLVEWIAGRETFLNLYYVTLKNCFRLSRLPHLPNLRQIELVDCNPSVVTYAKARSAEWGFRVCVDSTWANA